MTLHLNALLGIALGSSQAAGYVNPDGQIMGWLNELSFAPIDLNPEASIDEWSGDRGCGSTYLSQQCVFRLAPQVGIQIPAHLSNTEKLSFVQKKLSEGHEGAVKIWSTMGVYLGYAIAHYADYYELKNVIILGRCTSGEGGRILLDEAHRVMKTEFPHIAEDIKIHLPDEKNRRVGQAIAAASLPILP
jgi:predicted NBD/HSP70 family sugar kinase